MGTVVFTEPDGRQREVALAAGDSVMAAAVRTGVKGILGQCGGTLSCATCHVYVDADDLDRCAPMESFEDEMLDMTASERTPQSRLSCQVRPDGDRIRVTVVPTQL